MIGCSLPTLGHDWLPVSNIRTLFPATLIKQFFLPQAFQPRIGQPLENFFTDVSKRRHLHFQLQQLDIVCKSWTVGGGGYKRPGSRWGPEGDSAWEICFQIIGPIIIIFLIIIILKCAPWFPINLRETGRETLRVSCFITQNIFT